MYAVSRLRVNVKSLAAESRFIRHEIKRTNDKDEISDLQSHRVYRVKREARLAQLALAFVKSKPYKSAERTTNNPVKPEALHNKVKRFFPCQCNEIETWLNS